VILYLYPRLSLWVLIPQITKLRTGGAANRDERTLTSLITLIGVSVPRSSRLRKRGFREKMRQKSSWKWIVAAPDVRGLKAAGAAALMGHPS
jgi:hypothetical protein